MNPLTPYLGWIKAIGIGMFIFALLGLGAFGGYKWQEGNVQAAEKKASEAETARARWEANAKSYQDAIAAQKAANEAAIKEAQQQQAKADQATREARAERDKYQKRLAEIEAGIEHDKTDPSCKAELDRPVCGAPWR